MNKTTWVMLLLFLCVCSNIFVMDKQTVPNRWQEMATVLPDLVKYDGFPIAQDRYSVISFVNNRKIAYLGALQSAHPVDSLIQVAQPLDITHDELIIGAWKPRTGMQEFRLARLARGVLLQSQHDARGAEQEFKEVERSVYHFIYSKELFAPGEKALGHAARSCRLLTSNEHANAFRELRELKELAWIYPCWKRFVVTQCQMLVDAEYQPAFEMLKELAQGGVVEAQIHVLQDACAQAVITQDIAAQCSQIKVLVPYFESLVQHSEYNALAESLIQYTAAVHSYEKKQFSQTTQLLVELLKRTQETVPFKHINQLAHCLLEAVALQGDVRARCFTIAQNLKDTDKKVRRAGIENAAQLIQDLIAAQHTHRVDEFGIVEQLEKMASNNNGTACVLLAQWKCYQALLDAVTSENAETIKARHQVVKLYAELGLTGTKQQRELLKTIIRYVDGVVALCEGNLEAAAKQFIAAIDTGKIQNELDAKIRNKAGAYLIDLAKQGEWQARCRYALHRVHQDGKTITPETQAVCCTLAADFLESAPKELYKQESGVQLVAALRDVIALGNAQAQYLMSRLQFRLIHAGHEKTGLDDASIAKLDEVFKLAGAASKAGVKEASPFVKAVMQYRGAHGFLKKKLYDNAVEQLFGLLDVPLNEKDKALCTAFAEYQLLILAHAGNLTAGGWHVATLLETSDEEAILNGVAVCGRIFYGFLTQDVDQVTLDKWEKALLCFKKFQIIEKLERILRNDKQAPLHVDIAYVLSMGYLLQAMIPYKFMTDNAEHQKGALITSSVACAKQACESGLRQSMPVFREQLGRCYYQLGQHYLEINNTSDAVTALCEGSKLQHPGCMRAAAVMTLEQVPHEGAKMDQRMFNAQIATLERAFKMGDQVAGALLAEHYFDGEMNPFDCGHFLDKDIEKGITLARKIGAAYPPTARILGYLEFQRLILDVKGNKKVNLESPVRLLFDAAAGKQKRAYEHLLEVCTSAHCTKELAQMVIQFLEKQAADHVPLAACTLGSLLLLDKECRHVSDAISYFEDAIKYSNGQIGHFELATFYATHTQDGKKDVFKAAEHCIGLLVATARACTAPIDHCKYSVRILSMLRSFTGTLEEEQCAKERFDRIVALLQARGVKISYEEEVSSEEQQESVRGVRDDIGQMQEVTGAMGMIGNAVIDQILGEPGAIEKLRHTAAEGNPFSYFLLSKIYQEYAKTGKDATGGTVDKTVMLMESGIYAGQALIADRTNVEYAQQLGIVCNQLFNYLRTVVIPHSGIEFASLKGILEVINQGIQISNIAGLSPEDAQKIKKEAIACMCGLACKGCVPALEIYIKTHLYENEAAQDHALEITCACFTQLSGQGSVVWHESGVSLALKDHIDHIRKLVDSRKNAQGALALSLWYAAEYESLPLDDQVVSQTKAAVDRVWDYCVKAKEWGCTAAIPVWSMMRLSRSEKMSQEECEQALLAMEAVVQTNVSAAEFLIRLYRDGGVLPCGYAVAKDHAHAKRIAEQVKHDSRVALMTLAVLAKEQGDFAQFLEYALVLYKKGAYSLGDLTESCVNNGVLPQSIADHLEAEYRAGNMQILRALVIIRSCLNEYAKNIALLEEGIQRGSTVEYLELALLYLDPQFNGCNVDRSLEYLKLRLEAMKKEQCPIQDRKACLDRFAARLMFTVGIIENQVLKRQVIEAMDVVAQYAAEYIGKGYESVEILCMNMVYHCACESFDYKKIIATFERMLALSKVHPKPQDKDNMKCCATIIVKKFQELIQNSQLSRQILLKAETELCRMLAKADIGIRIVKTK